MPSPGAFVTRNRSTVGIDDALDDGQAQADAARRAAIHLPVTVKDDRQLLRRDSAAGTGDRNLGAAVGGVGADGDCAGVRRKFQRVADQVVEHLREALAIASHFGKIAGDVGDKLDATGGRARREAGDGLIDDGADGYRARSIASRPFSICVTSSRSQIR